MENPNLKKALAVLTSLLTKQTAQEKALAATAAAIERQKSEVGKLVAKAA